MVDELPLDDVLTAYFETQYEGMKEPQLDAEKAQLIETEAEKKNRIRKQDMDAIQFMETEAIAKSMKDLFGTTKPSTSAMPGLGSMMTEAANSLSGFVDAAKPPAIIQPDIKMTFLNDDQELETDSDSFGLFGKP